MNKSIFLAILNVLMSINISGQISNTFFEIRGIVNGFKDSTSIYLGDTDSTLIIDGKFHFSGTIQEKAKQLTLHTKGYSDYKIFWVEDTIITFIAEIGKFRSAIIIGSKTQDLQETLQKKVDLSGNETYEYISFIKNHANSIISAQLLDTYAATWEMDSVLLLFEKLSDDIKTHLMVKIFKNFSA
ncbi:DUF4369 domain-containing protein [Niabella hibiscisoli]|uniref:DUF4369 domain-containing protein n=1 Tax=Niabella hibiscisoli TaxID=1825928 RepID=UPI001F0D574B|nr:DUF4369 domain-containing protein [Niabella hibiscisoli]MCH5720320.1 DUF4369 domain-containing protein [Niabella hibiscisoli]